MQRALNKLRTLENLHWEACYYSIGLYLEEAAMPFHFSKIEFSWRKRARAKHLFLLVSIFALNCEVPACELIIYLNLLRDKDDPKLQ